LLKLCWQFNALTQGKKDVFSMVSVDDVYAAATRISGFAVRTPLLRSDALDAATGGKLWIKPECLQRTGSFKFRGAYNRLCAIIESDGEAGCAAGVVAYSSGNHAQGVAFAAKLLGMPATIIMPTDAPAVKIARTRGHGADVVMYDRLTEDRESIAAAIAEKRGAVIVPPFDDPYIVAGQGTAGLEIAADLKAMGVTADLAIVCCGGGGLTSGIALGTGLPVVPVEPEGYDDVARSLVAGRILRVENPGPTICDALQTLFCSPLTFGILSEHALPGVWVSEAEVMAAVAFAFRELKLVVEPGGSVALAAGLAGKVDLKGKTAAIVLSGGNVDADVFARCVLGPP
jgi:threonine dehydratase